VKSGSGVAPSYRNDMWGAWLVKKSVVCCVLSVVGVGLGIVVGDVMVMA
jgi:hypothetical protein